ncbi:hypothetical protein AAG570_014012 [Ranatra chinensis]|uniref:DUF11 domain-containing protein n=1 Tax=Ranatra chinensis TaxID=642074 RepID=A0ABD0XS53_9HEMI
MPNVRVVTYAYDNSKPGRLFFTSFKGNKKIKELEQNPNVSCILLPKDQQQEIQARIFGEVKKSDLTLDEVVNIIAKKLPSDAETIKSGGEMVEVYEVGFDKAYVTVGITKAEAVQQSPYSTFLVHFSTINRGIDLYKSLESYVYEPENQKQGNKDKKAKKTKPDEEEDLVVDFNSLKKINPEIVGWLTCKGTPISYPVVHTNNNDFYLDHLFNKKKNPSGCLFVDANNSYGWVDKNTIIYGHNMLDGSMFSTLERYNSSGYYQQYPEFELLTPEKNYKIEVFSGYYVPADGAAWNMYFPTDESFESWVSDSKAQSAFSSNVTLAPADQVITFSTCLNSLDRDDDLRVNVIMKKATKNILASILILILALSLYSPAYFAISPEDTSAGTDNSQIESSIGDVSSIAPESSSSAKDDSEEQSLPESSDNSISSEPISAPDNSNIPLPGPSENENSDIPLPPPVSETEDELEKLLPEEENMPDLAAAAGVSFGFNVAKSLDGTQPATFNASDSIDLTTVARYSMFYAYFKLDIANASGFDMVNPVITMQLPKLGDANYYEAITPNAAPAGWVQYPNTPSGDGNATFPVANLAFNATTRVMTWTAASTITNGSSGSIYIKLPMRDPYTNFGTYTYSPTLSYTSNGSATSNNATAGFTVSGNQDTMTQTFTQVTNLGYVPNETDAANYYYVCYQYNTNYSQSYIMPVPSYHLDQALAPSPTNVITLPANAQIINATSGTVSGNTVTGMTYGAKLYVRYPKADFTSPTDTVTVNVSAYGRFIGQSATTNPIANTSFQTTVPVGSSTIPTGNLGTVSLSVPAQNLSKETLMNNGQTNLIYSNPGALNIHTIQRNNSTITAKSMDFNFVSSNWVVSGSSQPAVYGLGQIQVQPPSFPTPLDATNPVAMTITVTYDDNTTAVLGSFTQAQLVNSSKFSAPIYHGTGPGYGQYVPPTGRRAVALNIHVDNVPPGFAYSAFLDGWVQTSGLDFANTTALQNNYSASLEGYDGTIASGSGPKVANWPIVANTTIQPTMTISRTSASTLNPGGVDTWQLKNVCSNSTKQSMVNPEFDVLLPAGFSYNGYVNQAQQGQTIGSFTSGQFTSTSPVITVVNNYNGTGRTLVKIKYTGILQFNQNISGQLSVKAGNFLSSGTYTADAYLGADNANFSNILDGTYTPIVTDTYDANMDGSTTDKLFRQPLSVSITQGTGTNCYTVMQGSLDPSYTAQANSKQGGTVNGQLVLSYNGSTTMNNIQLVGILPNENDGYSIFGQFLDGDHVTLSQAVDVSAYPGATVYYNTTSTSSLTDPGWTTTYNSNALSIKVVMPSSYTMVSGGNTTLTIPVVMKTPAAAIGADLLYVAGKGQLQAVAYASNVIVSTGLPGAISYIKNISLGIDCKIFEDKNKDGIKSTNENWISGVTVKLFNSTDNVSTATPLYTGTTDTNGEFWFADGINGVSLNMQGYKVVYVIPGSNYSFEAAIANVTTDNQGMQSVTLNTITPLVYPVAAYFNNTITISGTIWSDGEKPGNGILNSGTDTFSYVNGRAVKVYNTDTNSYISNQTTVLANGTFEITDVPVGPNYRVELTINSSEDVSTIPSSGTGVLNKMVKLNATTASYNFNSSGMANSSTVTVNGALQEFGTIKIRFATTTDTQIGTATSIKRAMPTSYTANASTNPQDVSAENSGNFTIPSGYKLVDETLAGSQKNATLNFSSTSGLETITFVVEQLYSDLALTKTSDKAGQTLAEGDTITYTINLKQNGNDAFADGIFTDYIPAGTTYVPGSSTSDPDANGKITWALPPVSGLGGTASVSFAVTVNTYTADTTTATWTIDNDTAHFESTELSVSQAINATIDNAARAILTISKVADKIETDIIDIDEELEYGIYITNDGAATSGNITVTDTVPNHMTYVSSDNNGVENGGVVTWNLSPITVGNTTLLRMVVKGASEGQAVNTATVNGVDTNTLTHTVKQKSPFLEISKTSDVAFGMHINLNSIITYTVHVQNTGDKAQPAYTITDKVPTNTTYVDASADNGGTLDTSTGIITWNMPILDPGASATVSFQAKGTTPGTVTNKANVAGTETNELIHFIKSPTTVLEISKASSIPANVKIAVDSTIVYTISVKNNGLFEVNNIPVSDVIPTGTSYVNNSADNNGTFSNSMVSWTIPAIAAGETIDLKFEVLALQKGTVSNVAQVNGVDTNTVVNEVDAPVTNLVYSKRGTYDDNTIVDFGETLTYYIDLENKGQTSILGTTVTDAIPSFVTLVSGSISNGGTLNNGTITWTIPTLLPGEKLTLSFNVKVTGYGTITNVASVDGFATNPITYYCDKKPKDDLSYNKTGTYPDQSFVDFGETITYTIKITNRTTHNILTTTVTDAIPADTTFVTGSITGGGVLKKGVITWKIPVIKPRQTITLTFKVKITGYGNIVNEAMVDKASTNKITYYVRPKPNPNPPVPPRTGDEFNVVWVFVLGLIVLVNFFKNTLGKITVLIATIAMIAVNGMSMFPIINGKTTQQISDSYPNLFTPTGSDPYKWKLLKPSQTLYHMMGKDGEFNLKFISSDGHFEAVYNKDGILLLQNDDPVNMVNQSKEEVVSQAGSSYYCYAIKTPLITEKDDIRQVVKDYVAPVLSEGDIVFISEKMLACTQGRAIPLDKIHPGFWAKFLCRFIAQTPAGEGLGTPPTMQCAIDECGLGLVLLGAAAGAVGKLVGTKGWFYKIAGPKAASIDGPCEWTIPPYDKCVILMPKDAPGVAKELSEVLGGATVLIVDVNDLGGQILGKSQTDLEDEYLLKLLKQNPLGQANQSTPMGILRAQK